jgi:hypothetical protein
MKNPKEEERILIDRYLSNSLSGTELKQFIDRLDSDSAFREEVVFQNLIVEAIREADQQRLEASIIESTRYKKPLVPLGLRLIILFFIVTASGILFWEYIGSGNSTGEHKPKFSFNIFKSKTKEIPVTKEKKKEIVPVDTAVADDNSTIDQPVNNIEETASSDTTMIADEEVVVKKDQLLVTMPFKPIPLDNAKDEHSMAQSTADKLNPSAGLPDEKEATEYMVEFWISPVNYKGYKLYNDKLILFGIEEPDAVHLYSFNNSLLMKYGKEFYRLTPVSDFVSFNVVKENSLPAALR